MDHLLNLVSETNLDTRTRLLLAKACVQLFGEIGLEARFHFLPKNIIAIPSSGVVSMPAIIRQSPRSEVPEEFSDALERLSYLNLGRLLFLLSTNHQAPSMVKDNIYSVDLDSCLEEVKCLKEVIRYCWDIFENGNIPNVADSVEKMFELLGGSDLSSLILEGYNINETYNKETDSILSCPSLSLIRRAVTRQNVNNFFTSPLYLKKQAEIGVEEEEREFLLETIQKLDRTGFLEKYNLEPVEGVFFDGTMTTLNSFVNYISKITADSLIAEEDGVESKKVSEHVVQKVKPELAKKIIDSLTLFKGDEIKESDKLYEYSDNVIFQSLRFILICRPFLTMKEASTNCELTPTGLRAPLITTSKLVPGSMKICDEYNYYAPTDIERAYGNMEPEAGDTLLVSLFPCCLVEDIAESLPDADVKRLNTLCSAHELVRRGGVDEAEFGPAHEQASDDSVFLEILSNYGQALPICAVSLGKTQ